MQRHIGEESYGWKIVGDGGSHGAFLLCTTLCRDVARVDARCQYSNGCPHMLAHFWQARIGRNKHIGYNQYAYSRRGLYTLESLRGVFYIKDTNTDKVGLRDSTVLYNIDMKTARQSTPQHEELDELAKRIETVLK